MPDRQAQASLLHAEPRDRNGDRLPGPRRAPVEHEPDGSTDSIVVVLTEPDYDPATESLTFHGSNQGVGIAKAVMHRLTGSWRACALFSRKLRQEQHPMSPSTRRRINALRRKLSALISNPKAGSLPAVGSI